MRRGRRKWVKPKKIPANEQASKPNHEESCQKSCTHLASRRRMHRQYHKILETCRQRGKLPTTLRFAFPHSFPFTARELWQWNFLSIPPTSNFFCVPRMFAPSKKARLDYLLTPSSLAQTLFSLFCFFFSGTLLSLSHKRRRNNAEVKTFFLNNAIFFERRET